MGEESLAPQIRERVWVTKFDHSTEPPTPVEEIFIENGQLMGIRQITPKESDDARNDEAGDRT